MTGLFVLGVALVGALVVGPLLNHAITWWIGWRVVVPPLLGRVPPTAELGHARARCPAPKLVPTMVTRAEPIPNTSGICRYSSRAPMP